MGKQWDKRQGKKESWRRRASGVWEGATAPSGRPWEAGHSPAPPATSGADRHGSPSARSCCQVYPHYVRRSADLTALAARRLPQCRLRRHVRTAPVSPEAYQRECQGPTSAPDHRDGDGSDERKSYTIPSRRQSLPGSPCAAPVGRAPDPRPPIPAPDDPYRLGASPKDVCLSWPSLPPTDRVRWRGRAGRAGLWGEGARLTPSPLDHPPSLPFPSRTAEQTDGHGTSGPMETYGGRPWQGRSPGTPCPDRSEAPRNVFPSWPFPGTAPRDDRRSQGHPVRCTTPSQGEWQRQEAKEGHTPPHGTSSPPQPSMLPSVLSPTLWETLWDVSGDLDLWQDWGARPGLRGHPMAPWLWSRPGSCRILPPAEHAEHPSPRRNRRPSRRRRRGPVERPPL